MRARLAILIAGSAALGGCAYGYGGYGPGGGISVGVGYGSGYGGYYGSYGYTDPFCSGYGYGTYGRYGSCRGDYRYGGYGYPPYWGWYGGYYYPGTGYYVYDRYRRPYVWSDHQRRYWSQRRERAGTNTKKGERTVIRENWSGFERRSTQRRSTESRTNVREQTRSEPR